MAGIYDFNFMRKLIVASEGELHGERRKYEVPGKLSCITALLLFGVAIFLLCKEMWGQAAFFFAMAVLQAVLAVTLQVKIWFIDLLAERKAETRRHTRSDEHADNTDAAD